MLTGWIEDKLALFAMNIDDFANASVRKEVMKGSENLSSDTEIDELAVWMKGAMDKLTSLVDEDTARKIMTFNACRFIDETFLGDTVGELAKLRALYSKNGDVEEIIQLMKQDRSYNGRSMFPDYELKGNRIFNTKSPCRQKEYEAAKDDYEKQLFYCYCPFVRATRERIPSVYCYCGAGFNKFIWEEITESEVTVELIESVLDEGSGCSFAIHLP